MRTLYRASRVHTLSHPQTGEWVLIDDRHVQRVGSGDPPDADRVVDLPGATILPGFIDTHVHLTRTGSAIANRDVEAAGSAAELLTLARDRASEGEGPVVMLGFDESRWDDPTHPALAALDAVTPRPLVIHRADGHMALANSAALDAAGIRSDQEGVERDANGVPTGRVTRDAVERLGRWAFASIDDNAIQELQLSAAGLGASNGVTAAHEMSMPHWLGLRDLQVFLGHRERLPMDVIPVVATTDIPQIMDLGLPSIGGDLPMDGSIGARTAALMAPYADSDGSGTSYHADDELETFFHAGHMAGLQVGVHAIGDRAIEQVLTVWERVYLTLDSRERRHFRARRHRIEHFEMASTSQIERAAMLGLAVSVQPTFDAALGTTRGDVRGGARVGPRPGDESVPDDDRPRHRGGRGIGHADHTVRPAAVDRGMRDASRCGATTLESRSDPVAHRGWGARRSSGRQEGCLEPRDARGHGGVRRGSHDRGVARRAPSDPHDLARSRGVRSLRTALRAVVAIVRRRDVGLSLFVGPSS